ncbi:Pup--protein ligase [Ornithinimicrobium sp. INDO-MA30-4]|uniref:Pup--protein ligase n=1 Tax=Ornithinimicrobium sp. INDO-MA30-4 TaxID=2908651 RepID=UPI001F2177A0|nr:Pup--protein ligase [Ornithinimicrobium sp. INDO-MA30-4]UJH71073.1 Pup--protein ligase [Ornithinimicrobium sp. INDO-MA30-4]
MDRRVYGIETEFGVTCAFTGDKRLSSDEVARYLFRKVVTWGRSSNVFLGNGARLYLDVGSHPEYATAECDSVDDLIAQEKAGELIVHDLALDAERRMANEGIEARVYVLKNNVDSRGNSYGSHENYLVRRAAPLSRITDSLIPFLITRQLLTGAGHLQVTGERATYQLSQRADHMWEGLSSSTTRSRPIINTRDEPHADAEQFRRLHVIVGDSTMSETTTRLRVLTTGLLLAAIEAGTPMGDLSIADPVRAIRAVSRDKTGTKPIKLATGRTMSALEMQYAFLAKARSFAESSGLIEHETYSWALELWERGLHAVESEQWGLIDTEIEWAMKWRMMERYAAKFSLGMADPRMQQIDMAWHDIHPDRGLYNLLAKRGNVARIVTDADAKKAMVTPPQTTRAKMRGEFIQAAHQYGRDYSVDWVHLKLNDVPATTVMCRDPLVARDERVDRLLAGIRAGTPSQDSVAAL